MEKPLLIILRMAESNHPHMDKLQFTVLMVAYQIRMSMPEINNEDYFPPVIELEYDEYEEGPGDDDSPGQLSDNEYVSDTEDGMTSQDKNQLG